MRHRPWGRRTEGATVDVTARKSFDRGPDVPLIFTWQDAETIAAPSGVAIFFFRLRYVGKFLHPWLI